MQTVQLNRQQRWLTLAAAAILALSLVRGGGGPVCEGAGDGAGRWHGGTSGGPNPTFTLTTQTGYVGTPDGK